MGERENATPRLLPTLVSEQQSAAWLPIAFPFLSHAQIEWWVWLTPTVRNNPRKLNREKLGQGSSAKILVLENF